MVRRWRAVHPRPCRLRRPYREAIRPPCGSPRQTKREMLPAMPRESTPRHLRRPTRHRPRARLAGRLRGDALRRGVIATAWATTRRLGEVALAHLDSATPSHAAGDDGRPAPRRRRRAPRRHHLWASPLTSPSTVARGWVVVAQGRVERRCLSHHIQRTAAELSRRWARQRSRLRLRLACRHRCGRLACA